MRAHVLFETAVLPEGLVADGAGEGDVRTRVRGQRCAVEKGFRAIEAPEDRLRRQ